jgi:hypothetical protein
MDKWSARLSDLYLQNTTFATACLQDPRGFGTHSLTRGAAAGLSRRPRGNWDQLPHNYTYLYYVHGLLLKTLLIILQSAVCNELCVKREYCMWNDYNISRFYLIVNFTNYLYPCNVYKEACMHLLSN